MSRLSEDFGVLQARGLLFDMDGTLLDSTAPMIRVWGRWADRHGLEHTHVLSAIHGRRAVESIGSFNLVGVDAQKEARWIEDEEVDDVAGVIPIAGAVAFLNRIPRKQWAVVTSAPIRLAKARLGAAGIRLPDIMVTGEDVKRGKPFPDCFQLGAQRLGLPADECIAFEDAPAGIAAADAAGARVVVITATHHSPHETLHRKILNYEKLVLDQNGQHQLSLRLKSSVD